MSTHKVLSTHSSFSFELHFAQRDRAIARCDRNIVTDEIDTSRPLRRLRDRCRKNFQFPNSEFGKRAGPRIEGANFSLNCFG